ncbi:hypothetical protein EMCRGX_G024368 [Ephydatia muelleri]
MSLSLLPHDIFVRQLKLKLRDAARAIGDALGIGERTFRARKETFLVNINSFPDSLQGKYCREGVLWSDEGLNAQAQIYAFLEIYLWKQRELGFEIIVQAADCPTCENGNHLPDKTTIFVFHDESIFTTKDGQKWPKDTPSIAPKGNGSGIMVSDFIEEKDGFLRVIDEAGNVNEARVLFEYGKNHEGYWTSHHFMHQIENAVKVAEAKYPKESYCICWIFDHSSCHNTNVDNVLIASNMNAKPGGKQHMLRDTVWKGRVQKMV